MGLTSDILDYSTTKTKHWSLPVNYGDFKKELYITNQTGVALVYMDREKKPNYIHPNSITDRGSLLIHSVAFTLDDPTKSIRDAGKQEGIDYTITKARLIMRPVLIRELGICIGIQGHEAAMADIIDETYFYDVRKQLREFMAQLTNENSDLGVVGSYLTNDESISRMYGMWNDIVFPLMVIHTKTKEETNIVSFAMKNDSKHKLFTSAENLIVNGDHGERYVSLISEDHTTWYSESPEKLKRLYHEEKIKQTAKLTEALDKLSETETSLETVSSELEITKKRLNTEQIKNKTLLDDTKKTHEENLMNMKLEHEKEINDFKKYQAQESQSSQREAHLHEMEMQQIKKDKEIISAKSAEISAASTNMKTMVTAIPIAVSAAVLMNGVVSSGNNAAIGVAALNPTLAMGTIAVAAAATVGYNFLPEETQEKVKHYGKSIYNYSKNVISRIGKCAKKAAKKIKKFCSAVLDFFF